MEQESAATASSWLPVAAQPGNNPQLGLAFARAYERTATRIMAPISAVALKRIGRIDRETRLLDIAAGTGALSVPAAYRGAAVSAIDIAPGMIERLTELLRPFPRAQAQVMDGQSLNFPTGSFDAALSVMGVSMFDQWRTGLAEQVRVLQSGGTAVLATWRTLPGGGPFVVMSEALRTIFPDRPPPAPPPGFVELAPPDAMAAALRDAGLKEVSVEEIDAVWEGPSGSAYLEDLRDLHPFMGPYADLDLGTRARLDDAILEAVERRSVDGRVVMSTTVTLGTGRRP